eukprot:TRINITY_DN16916_c0_g1_i1.p1 TRINITY_DN16916_c0_g1~~TRINITY_DN16916_c0_g1_i1.p1  ORF type:complete len:126 (-),score=6.29 TRINITY_DN16916_c0_g1_i1:41-418(-)
MRQINAIDTLFVFHISAARRLCLCPFYLSGFVQILLSSSLYSSIFFQLFSLRDQPMDPDGETFQMHSKECFKFITRQFTMQCLRGWDLDFADSNYIEYFFCCVTGNVRVTFLCELITHEIALAFK